MIIDTEIGRVPPRLTPAQSRVAELIKCGLTSKEMARELGVSPSAIDQRIMAIKRRLGVEKRRDLVRVLHTERAVAAPEKCISVADAPKIEVWPDTPCPSQSTADRGPAPIVQTEVFSKARRFDLWSLGYFCAGFFAGTAVAAATFSLSMLIAILHHLAF